MNEDKYHVSLSHSHIEPLMYPHNKLSAIYLLKLSGWLFS